MQENQEQSPVKIEALTGIRIDQYNSISLKSMTNLEGHESDSLYIAVESNTETSSFFFDNAAEAKTFCNRMLEALRYFED